MYNIGIGWLTCYILVSVFCLFSISHWTRCQPKRLRLVWCGSFWLFLYRLNSSVEFAIASALTNLNCLLPGRLSLLIRPFMDTIRCICPTPSTSDLQSSKNLEMLLTTQMLPTGSNLPLQRLATVCLVRLLRLEWAVHARKQPAGAPNPSKAALKVVKNLATSLLESDPRMWDFRSDLLAEFAVSLYQSRVSEAIVSHPAPGAGVQFT